jgi:hypothetical protein
MQTKTMLTRIRILVAVAVLLVAVLPAADGGPALAADAGVSASAKRPLSDEEVGELVAGAPAETDVPGADAVVLFEGTFIEYADGKASIRRQRLVKVFTEWAIDHVGDPRLAFDSARQELEVHASRTYLGDGTTVDTPDNGYNEVTPSRVALSRDHLSIREMVVTHVGLERGVSILLDYSITDTSQADLPFNRLFFLHDEFPTLERVIVMEGDLVAEVVNPSVGLYDYSQPERDGDRLTWHMADLPARPHHQDERLGDQIPWLAVSSAGIGSSSMKSWPAMLLRLGKRVREAASVTGGLEDILGDLEEGTPFLTEREAIERMADMVSGRTALLSYDPWVFTPWPRDVSECLETSTATPLERAALVIACCEARKRGVRLALPARGESLTRDVPVLEVLGDPLVRATAPDRSDYWINPVSGTVTELPPVAEGITYFIVDLYEVEKAVAEDASNTVKLDGFWDLEEGIAAAEIEISGPAALGLGWKEPEELARGWAESVSESAKVEELEILRSGPDGIRFTVKMDAPCPEADDRGRIQVDLPLPPVGPTALLPDGIDLARSEIDGALFFPAPGRADVIWRFRPPEGHDLVAGPSLDLEWEDTRIYVKRKERPPNKELVYTMILGGRAIIPDEYPGYRTVFLEATDPRMMRLVFTEEEAEE